MLDQVRIVPDRFACAITPVAPGRRFLLQARDEQVGELACSVLGLAAPGRMNAASASGEHVVLRLGPGEWMLLRPERDPAPGLAEALAGLPHALVDVSHRQLGFALSGGGAATVLAAGCPLDLDERIFSVGMATRTVFGKAEIVLWRTEPDGFRLDVARSFAAYVTGLLEQARADWLWDASAGG